jgi:hypothetical protein
MPAGTGDRFGAMQRIACLLIGITTACGGGTESGPADLTGTTPPGKSVGARVFSGADGAGNQVRGWKLEFFEQGPGADCLSAKTILVASVAIYTNQPADSSDAHAILMAPGDIPIVMENPPTVAGNAAANMGGKGVTITSGIVTISEFHLTDVMHADRIKGTITAGGTDGTGNPVSVAGSFDAPYCPEED